MLNNPLTIGLPLLIFLLISCSSDKMNVPEKVREAYSKDFPNTGDVRWERELGLYEAEFEKEGTEYVVRYSKEGIWEGTEINIEEKDLPPWVIDTLPAAFPNNVQKEFSRIEGPDGQVRYLIEIQHGGKVYDVLFKEDHSILKLEEQDDD